MYSLPASVSARRASGPTRSPLRTIGVCDGSNVMSSSSDRAVELFELRLDLLAALGGRGGVLLLAASRAACRRSVFSVFEALELTIQVAA